VAAVAEPPETRRGVARLSYSSLQEYARCGYRFYAQRVLGLPPVEEASGTAAAEGLNAAERGVLVHGLLEKLDFGRRVGPSAHEIADAAERPLPRAEAERIATLVGLFLESEMCSRVARSSDVRREERFAFLLGEDVLITGALDVLAREPGGRMLVLDYKSDRIEGADPARLVSEHYATQQLIYGLAALRAGARTVHVVHLFLEAPGDPVVVEFSEADQPELESRLAALAAGARRREFRVTDQPHRGICSACPAEGGLCSWPLELTRREAPDRLF
jgi:RecB family exonuclease